MVAGLVVRGFGAATFAEYSLIFGIMAVAEWMADFGLTELFVREICREPERRDRLLRIVTAAKAVQVPAAYVVMAAALLALRYPTEIVEAGLIGGASMVFFGGVLVYRVLFRAGLTMEREVLAELVSVVVMIPLIALASRQGAGLRTLLACHLVSRAAFFAMSFLLGRSRYRPSVAGVTWADVRWGLRAAAAMGAIGLLVGVYEVVEIVLLSKLDFPGVSYYAGAQRLIWPILLALTAVGGTLYPVLASRWPHAPGDFERALQRGLDSVVALAGLALSSLLAGAEFFMGLLGPSLVTGAPVLRILVLLCFAKAISSTLGPVLYVVHAQRQALQFIAVAVAVKIVVIAALAARFGYVGVAFGALGVELCFGVLPAVSLLQRFTGYRLRWSTALKVVMVTAVAAGVPWLGSMDGLAAALLAPALYVPLAFLSGAVQLSDLRALLGRKEP